MVFLIFVCLFIHSIGSKDKNVKSTPCLSNRPQKSALPVCVFSLWKDIFSNLIFGKGVIFIILLLRGQFFGSFFPPRGHLLKKNLPFFPQIFFQTKRNQERHLKTPVKLLLFFLEVRQARLPKGRDLVSKLQFCDCSRYSDCVSVSASQWDVSLLYSLW